MDIFNQIVALNQGLLITLAEIAVFTVFLSLIIYHLIIYIGRRKFTEGKIYLYFSLLLTGFLVYIFLDTNLYYVTVSLVLNTDIWTTFFTSLSWALILKSTQLLLNSFVKPSPKSLFIFSVGNKLYILMMGIWLLPLVPFFNHPGFAFFKIFWMAAGFFIALQTFLYFGQLKRQGPTLDAEIKIIAWGVLFYIIYIWLYRIVLMNFPAQSQLPLWMLNNCLKIFMAFTFAYALARKFNREYADLTALKNHLESKVEEGTRELRLVNEKLEEASKVKTNYFIHVAHETKTPLTLIANYLDRYIKRNGESFELDIIRDNFYLLRETMIRFLDAEKFERGDLVYNHNQVTGLSEVMATKMRLYNEIAMHQGRMLVQHIQESIFIKADVLAVERIINNLFENALKFTNESDEIRITLIRDEEMARITVSDTGIGIQKSHLPHIFERFYQGPQDNDNRKGLGMGLYIVKQTVESLSGKISVHSLPGQGTEFTVCLPLSEETSMSVALERSLYPVTVRNETSFIPLNYEADRKNLLIVEDNSAMIHYLSGELTGDYNIFTARNGVEALEKLRNSPRFDLILSDVMMEKMDGFEFYDMISKDEAYGSIPFIFITARSNEAEKIKNLDKGVTDYIFKPFSVEELKAKIRSVLINTGLQRKAGLKDAIKAIHSKLEMPVAETHDKWQIFELRVRDYGLTERQVEVIKEVEKGNDYKQIAEKLNISQKTIHRHIQNLFEKFHVHSKIELLKMFFE